MPWKKRANLTGRSPSTGELSEQGGFNPRFAEGPAHPCEKRDRRDIVLDGERIFVHEDNENCPKKICSMMGSITRPGESIVCLPNKLVLRVL